MIRQTFQRRICHKSRDIQIQHIVFVDMLFIARIRRNSKAVKKCMRITAAVIIGFEHIGRIGLSKAPRPADAGEPASLVYGSVDHSDQTRFVHIIVP